MLFHCDRCKKKIEGDEDAGCLRSGFGAFTSGFYYVDSGSYWAKYARSYETVVCEPCMWCDPAYIADYGDMMCKSLNHD